MDNDIMEYLGLEVQTDWGDSYDRDDKNKKLVEVAGHAMVAVWIDGKSYLMEPQEDTCEFYDRAFKKEYRKVEVEFLQEEKKSPIGESSTAGKSMASTARGAVQKSLPPQTNTSTSDSSTKNK
jgi:hypothetical protein